LILGPHLVKLELQRINLSRLCSIFLDSLVKRVSQTVVILRQLRDLVIRVLLVLLEVINLSSLRFRLYFEHLPFISTTHKRFIKILALTPKSIYLIFQRLSVVIKVCLHISPGMVQLLQFLRGLKKRWMLENGGY
jgi:hypothetical protein